MELGKEFSLNIKKETQKREDGTKDFFNFLSKVENRIDWKNPQSVFEYVKNVSEEEYTALLTRINGLLTSTSTQEREFIPENGSGMIATPKQSMFTETSIVFPDMNDRQEIQHNFFEKMNETIVSEKESETLPKRVAIGVFNSIIYIHPFKDGNGRTARVAYTLLNPSSREANIQETLSKRSPLINEYHYQLNMLMFFDMLQARGLLMDDVVEGQPYEYKYRMATHDTGFDARHLSFFAAYDAMSDEERHKYNKGTRKNELVFDSNDFPESLLKKYQENLSIARKEFTEHLLDFSLDKEGQISVPWLQDAYLDKAL